MSLEYLYGALSIVVVVRSWGSSPCSTEDDISSSRPEGGWPPGRSGSQGWPQAIAKRLALDGREHGGRLRCSGELSCSGQTTTIPRGARHQARRSRRNLVFGRSVRTGTMMQSCASVAKLRGGGPILHSGLEAMGLAPGHRPLGSSSADRSLGCRGGFLFSLSSALSLMMPDARPPPPAPRPP